MTTSVQGRAKTIRATVTASGSHSGPGEDGYDYAGIDRSTSPATETTAGGSPETVELESAGAWWVRYRASELRVRFDNNDGSGNAADARLELLMSPADTKTTITQSSISDGSTETVAVRTDAGTFQLFRLTATRSGLFRVRLFA